MVAYTEAQGGEAAHATGGLTFLARDGNKVGYLEAPSLALNGEAGEAAQEVLKAQQALMAQHDNRDQLAG